MKFKALVLGLGQIGMGYDLLHNPSDYIITHARAFHQHPNFELIGGVDVNKNNCESFTKEYSCPSFSNIKEALHITKPDIIAIALPTGEHRTAVEQIFEIAKPSVILCEKPLAYNLEDAKVIYDKCNSNSCKLYVNYMRISDPGFAEITKRIKSEVIERPLKGVVWYSKGLFNNGSHFFSLMQSWLGEMTDYKIINSGRTWNGLDPEPDFQVEFKHGNVTFLSAKEECFSHYTVELIAPNGRLSIEQGGAKIIWQSISEDLITKGYITLSNNEEVIPTNMARSQWNVVEQIAQSIMSENYNLCDGLAAISTIESLEKIRVSL